MMRKLEAYMEQLAKQDLCVAFSGGVDSSLLLKIACSQAEKTGRRVYAVTFDTCLHPACDLENAARVAGEIGAQHEILRVNELELDEIRNNPVNRCYLCKRHMFTVLKDWARARGITCVLDGTNEDDLHVYRPGIQALKELGIVSPLAENGITKEEARQMASTLGLSVSSRPSTPCMATRLPYNTPLDVETLKRIEDGEAFLRTVLSGNIRLRLHGDVARLEVDEGAMDEVLKMRNRLVDGLKGLGFRYISLDLQGFRSGCLRNVSQFLFDILRNFGVGNFQRDGELLLEKGFRFLFVLRVGPAGFLSPLAQQEVFPGDGLDQTDQLLAGVGLERGPVVVI